MLALIRISIFAIISYVIIIFAVLNVYDKVPQFKRLTKVFSPTLISVGISSETHVVSITRAVGHIELDSTPGQFKSTRPSRDTHTRSRDTLTTDSESSAGEPRKSNEPPSERVIRILTWTEISPSNPFWFGSKLEGTTKCGTRIPCVYTNNRSVYNTSDVIVFHTRYIYDYSEMPTFRLPRQHWITYLHETPVRTLMTVMSPYESWFNWTYTYSVDGDIVTPYGICLPNRDKVTNDPSSITDVIRLVYGKSAESTPWIGKHARRNDYTAINYARDKTDLVLWAVSHCKTPGEREKYAAELKRYIPVDIVGGCVRKKFDKSKQSNLYMGRLLRSHKFYLAFENSICSDYITEKLWSHLSHGIVPIVLGGADYKTFLPPHSYIDVKDYSSPKALATYLHKLDNNDTLYNEYFAWERNYTCYKGVPGKSHSCDICKFINENLNITNTISDINRFWSRERCILPEQYYDGIATLSYNDAFSEKKNLV